MACISGKNGALSLAGANVAQLTSWTITQSAETIEGNYMGEAWRCVKPGTQSWEGTCEALFDTSHDYVDIGAEVALIAYETGTTTTYSGNVVITSIETTATNEDMITTSISFVGDGQCNVAA